MQFRFHADLIGPLHHSSIQEEAMSNESQWRAWLRFENMLIFAIALFSYYTTDASWWTFLILFLVPDLSILAYGIGKRAGAALYNASHSYAAPVIWAGAAQFFPQLGVDVAIIWVAHISLDRMLGFGLKSTAGFAHTHLGEVNIKQKAS